MGKYLSKPFKLSADSNLILILNHTSGLLEEFWVGGYFFFAMTHPPPAEQPLSLPYRWNNRSWCLAGEELPPLTGRIRPDYRETQTSDEPNLSMEHLFQSMWKCSNL